MRLSGSALCKAGRGDGAVGPPAASAAATQFPLLEAVEFTNEGDGTLAVKAEAYNDPQAFLRLVTACVPDLLCTPATTSGTLQPRPGFTSRFQAAAARCDT